MAPSSSARRPDPSSRATGLVLATMPGMGRTFEDLVAEANSVSVDGWDFSWLDGRATEERPSWGYQRLISRHFAKVSAALESADRRRRGAGRGGTLPAHDGGHRVVAAERRTGHQPLASAGHCGRGDAGRVALPFADEAFDLVTAAIQTPWVVGDRAGAAPRRHLLAQHVGPRPWRSWSSTSSGRSRRRGPCRHPTTKRGSASRRA